VQQLLKITDTGYGHIVSAFLLASAIAYLLSGFLSDKLGTKWSMAIFVAWWSISEALTATANSFGWLSALRFSLGLGEPGLWVAAPKAVSEYFPKEERALAIGIYTSGASIGAVLALPVIVAVSVHLSWRSVFLFDGLAGILWIPAWLLLYRRIRRVPEADNELASELDGQRVTAIEADEVDAKPDQCNVFQQPNTWRLLVARALTDPVWYFYLFWFPKYLFESQHVAMARVAHIGWIVYLAAGVGTVAGGWSARELIRSGWRTLRAHRALMACCVIVLPLSPMIAYIRGLSWVVGVAALLVLAHMCWLTNLTAMVVDLFPSGSVGRAAGLIAAGSACGGIVFSELIGHIVMRAGYTPALWMMGMLHPLALWLLWPIGRTPKPNNIR
jgi:ACS family hexuronate transporter-like MFS transporter